jgi:hypothetical protein
MAQIEVKGFLPGSFQGSEFSLRVLDVKKKLKKFMRIAGQGRSV